MFFVFGQQTRLKSQFIDVTDRIATVITQVFHSECPFYRVPDHDSYYAMCRRVQALYVIVHRDTIKGTVCCISLSFPAIGASVPESKPSQRLLNPSLLSVHRNPPFLLDSVNESASLNNLHVSVIISYIEPR
jgi:hypothetical protein